MAQDPYANLTPELNSAIAQQAMQYATPATIPYIQRSAYLADALRNMRDQGGNIRTRGALASNLLAEALLQFGKRRADKALLGRETSDQNAMVEALLAGTPMGGPGASPGATPAPPAQTPPSAPGPLASGGPPPDWDSVGRDTKLMAQLLMGEAGGNDAGQRAVASVVMNRAGSSGMSPGQVMRAPGQFEPLNNPRTFGRLDAIPTDDPRFQQALGNAVSVLNNGQTTNADHFWSPQAQASLGRAPPRWAAPGQNIGGNVFTHNGYSAPPGFTPPAPPPQQTPQPYQVASNGPVPAPGAGAVGGGPPPAPPQPAPALGGYTAPPMGMAMTPQEKQQVDALRHSGIPALQHRAMEMAQAIHDRATTAESAPAGYRWNPSTGQYEGKAPTQWKEMTINGLPGFYDPENPTHIQMGAVPPSAMTHRANGPEAGIPGAPLGSRFNVDPLGNATQAYMPPQGYDATARGMAPIPGGPNDPTTGANRLQGLQSFRAEVRPLLDTAAALKSHVNAVRSGYQAHNGTGDIAMINGFQKMVDEGVVRGEDINLQMQAQGLQGTIGSYMQYLQGGGKLDDATRERVLKAAEGLYGLGNDMVRSRAMGYQGIVDRTYGPGSFSDVIPPPVIEQFGWGPKPPLGPTPAPMSAFGQSFQPQDANQAAMLRQWQGGGQQPAPGAPPAAPGQPRVRTYNPHTGGFD